MIYRGTTEAVVSRRACGEAVTTRGGRGTVAITPSTSRGPAIATRRIVVGVDGSNDPNAARDRAAAAWAERVAPGISIAGNAYPGSPGVAFVGEKPEPELLVAGSRAVADSVAWCSALSIDSACIAHDAPCPLSAGASTTPFQPKPAGPRARSGPGPARSSLQRRQP